MLRNTSKKIRNFFIAGINYRKTDAELRGRFALSNEKYIKLLESAPDFDVHEIFVVSTCNRTEVYGFAENPSQLISLLCSQTEGSAKIFTEICYTKNGKDAIEHLFFVGAGLDSQILGDYEIVGQIKKAAKLSKQYNRLGAFTERLVNAVLHSSKAIKNQTELSGGTISVSFAAVQYLRRHVKNIKEKNILLLGTGKIGRNTCKNLVDYLDTPNITLVNRTEEKAIQLATELKLRTEPIERLEQVIACSDIILVATSAEHPTILLRYLKGRGRKLILDLSVPYNVEQAVQELENVSLINVDELSRMKDETLARREAEVPRARQIISEHFEEFVQWHEMRRHVPVLKAVKHKLKEIHASTSFIPFPDQQISAFDADNKIQRVVNGVATKLKQQDQKGCYYIEAINEFLATGA